MIDDNLRLKSMNIIWLKKSGCCLWVLMRNEGAGTRKSRNVMRVIHLAEWVAVAQLRLIPGKVFRSNQLRDKWMLTTRGFFTGRGLTPPLPALAPKKGFGGTTPALTGAVPLLFPFSAPFPFDPFVI
jgi:hypothetical protein